MDEDAYRQLLQTFLAAGYRFGSFRAGEGLAGHGVVRLRHDLDVDPGHALRLAGIERELGVRSTFFVQVSCPLYNPFSPPGQEVLARLRRDGHAIGLHVLPEAGTRDQRRKVRRELDLLQAFVPDLLTDLVSLHRPASYAGALDELVLPPGVEHTYSARWCVPGQYFSDSTGRWRFGSPLDSQAFARRADLHVLTHPVWWTQPGADAGEKLTAHAEAHDRSYRSALFSEAL